MNQTARTLRPGLGPALLVFRALVGFGEIEPRFVEGALGVVVGLDGETVFIDGAVALAGEVKDLANLNVAPDFSPRWLVVAAEGIAVGVDAGLVVALGEEDFADAVVGEGALRVGLEGFLVLREGAYEVALGDELLALEDGDADLEVGSGFEDPAVGVDGDAAGTAEGVNDELGVCADDVDFLIDGFAFGIHADVDGHVEEVEVLGDVADGAEALVIAEAIDAVFVFEGGRAGAIDPLGEEGREVLLALGFGDLLKIV